MCKSKKLFSNALVLKSVALTACVAFASLQSTQASAAYSGEISNSPYAGAVSDTSTSGLMANGKSETQRALNALIQIHRQHQEQGVESIVREYEKGYSRAIRSLQGALQTADATQRRVIMKRWDQLYSDWTAVQSDSKEGILTKESQAIQTLQNRVAKELVGETRGTILCGFQDILGILLILTLILAPIGVSMIDESYGDCVGL